MTFPLSNTCSKYIQCTGKNQMDFRCCRPGDMYSIEDQECVPDLENTCRASHSECPPQYTLKPIGTTEEPTTTEIPGKDN